MHCEGKIVKYALTEQWYIMDGFFIDNSILCSQIYDAVTYITMHVVAPWRPVSVCLLDGDCSQKIVNEWKYNHQSTNYSRKDGYYKSLYC